MTCHCTSSFYIFIVTFTRIKYHYYRVISSRYMYLPFDWKISRILRGCLGDASAMHRRCFWDASGTAIYREKFGDASPNNRGCFGDASPTLIRDKTSGIHRENFQCMHWFFYSTRDDSRCQKQSHDVADALANMFAMLRDVSRSSKGNDGSTSRVHRERKKA